MKTAVIIIGLIALVSAAPKVTKLRYRNLYKKPIVPVEHSVEPRIINGQEAAPNSIPFQAFLEVYALFEGWYCGGSLISENYVVTAGHCGDGAMQAYVTLGAHKPQSNEPTQVQIVSTDIKVHPDYDADKIINDIAVIALPNGVSLTDAIQPVKLPANSENNYTGSTARASGWGLTDGNADRISDVLNYVDVKVISNKECEDIYGPLPESIVCTSGRGGTCSGDSGGPLVVDNVLIGVTSFGVEGCDTQYPSAFSRVSSFLSWLSENTDV